MCMFSCLYMYVYISVIFAVTLTVFLYLLLQLGQREVLLYVQVLDRTGAWRGGKLLLWFFIVLIAIVVECGFYLNSF